MGTKRIVAAGTVQHALPTSLTSRAWAETTLVSTTPHFTLFPEAFDQPRADVAYFKSVTGLNTTPLINHLPEFKARLAFEAPVENPWKAGAENRVVHVITMLADQAVRQSACDNGKHLLAFVALQRVFLLGLERGKLELATCLPGNDDETRLYSLMFTAEQAGFNYREDRVWLAGNVSSEGGFESLLKKYWVNVEHWPLPTGVRWADGMAHLMDARWAAAIPVME